MRKFFALALLCLVFVTISCEKENLSTEREATVLKVMNGDTIDVYVGDTTYINVKHFPNEAPAPKLYWYGYNQLLLKANDKEGFIVGRRRGSTILNVGARESDISTSCVVNILPIPLNLSYAERVIGVADTFSIKPILPNGVSGIVRWRTTESTVATVDLNGVVKGLSAGECEISAVAYINNDTLCSNKCHVVVNNVDMESLALNDTLREVALKSTFNLRATYIPSNTTFSKIVWSSSDKKVATVDSNGNVATVGLGSCVITATNKESGLTAQCIVNVLPQKMESLVLSETEITMELHSKYVLGASFEPLDATFQELLWFSSDEKVAKVKNGEVEAVGTGECSISVVNKENALTAKCNVKVYITEMTSISCLAENSLIQGESFTLTASYVPHNATNIGNVLRWHSSDESIATVDELSGKVYGKNVGECTITISNIYNSVTATCHLTVLPIPVNRISLSSSSEVLLIGQSAQLTCTISPSNAYNKDVKWESSDNSIATVDEGGMITAISKGKTVVKVTAQDGSGCSAECVVKVVDEKYMKDYIENNISIIQTGYSITNNGISYTLTATNNGDTDVYLKEVRGYGSSSGTISINKKIAQGESYSGSFNSNSLDWVFEIGGVEYIKRY